MSDFDPNPTVLRGRGGMKPGAAKSAQAVNAARRRGEDVATEQKYGAGGNRQGGTSLNTAVLDRETEELKHAKVGMDVGKLIQKGRQAKGWTQKELATKICEKPQVRVGEKRSYCTAYVEVPPVTHDFATVSATI